MSEEQSAFLQRCGEESAAHTLMTELKLPYPAAEFNYLTHISMKNQYVYLETPKVACTTIKVLLNRLESINLYYGWRENPDDPHNRLEGLLLMPDHMSVAQLRYVLGSEGFKKICFVRNPFTRLLSAYLSQIMGERTFIRSNFQRKYGVPYYKEIDFEMFVRCITEDDPRTVDVHWRPLVFLVHVDHVTLDIVGRFENIKEDLSTIVKTLYPFLDVDRVDSLTDEVGVRGKPTDSDNLVDTFYTERLKSLVRKYYERDFEYFGYADTI